LTGDHYYADEIAFWANRVLLESSQQQRHGLLWVSHLELFAYALLHVIDAAAYLPDDNADKPYFAKMLAMNLQWLDDYAQEKPGTPTFSLDPNNDALGSLFVYHPDVQTAVTAYVSTESCGFIAWVIDHAAQQGFSAGLAARDRMVSFQISLLSNNATFPSRYGLEGNFFMGTVKAGVPNYFATLADLFAANFQELNGMLKSLLPPSAGARAAVVVGVTNHFPNAASAYTFLTPFYPVSKLRGDFALAPVAP
jgi:hypothetical protein